MFEELYCLKCGINKTLLPGGKARTFEARSRRAGRDMAIRGERAAKREMRRARDQIRREEEYRLRNGVPNSYDLQDALARLIAEAPGPDPFFAGFDEPRPPPKKKRKKKPKKPERDPPGFLRPRRVPKVTE